MAVSDYDDVIEAAGKEWNVDPHLLRAVMQQESGGKPGVVSRAGARGLMQVMPGTGAEMGATNIDDPAQNIFAGAKYLSQQLDRFGNPAHALIAYNAGPARVDQFIKGGSLPAETLAYVPAVTSHYARFKNEGGGKGSGSDVPSDADFLKMTTGGAAGKDALPSDEEFLKSTGATTPAPVEPPAIQAQNPDNPGEVLTGPNTSQSGTAPQQGAGGIPTGVIDAVKRVGSAVASPWQDGSAVSQWMDANPAVFNGNIMGATNRLVIGMPLQALEAAGKGVQSLARGAGALAGSMTAAAGDTSSNRLERDIAQAPDAVLAGMGMAAPGMAARGNKLTPVARNAELDNALLPLPGSPAALRDRINPTAAPMPGETLPAVRGAVPESVGAAATAPALAGIGKEEAAAYLKSDNGKRLMELQRVNEPDRTQYVPGTIVTEAEQTQNPQLARADRDLLRQPGSEARTIMEARLQHNNEAINNRLGELAGNAVSVLRMKEVRGEELNAALAPLWRSAKEANIEPVRAEIQSVLDGPSAVKTPVENALKSVKARMDKFGDKMKNPEYLWNLRQHIDELIKHNGATDAPQSWLAAKELNKVRDVVTRQIEDAAPGFKQMSENYAKATAEINGKQYILDNMSSLVDSKGMITPQKFFNFMRRTTDAIDGRIETGASSLTPEQLSALWDINSHFRRQKSAFDLGNAVGESNTVQGSMDWVKDKATTLMDAGVHTALAPLGGVPNMIYKEWREKGTARREQNKLNQRIETYSNPPPLRPRVD